MKKNIIRNIVCALLIGMLGIELWSPNVNAASVSANLFTDQEKAPSAQLGNTTGKYNVFSENILFSKYSTDFWVYYGKTSNHCGLIRDHWTLEPYSNKEKTLSISKEYTTARITIYGNLKSNQKKECRANATLSNK